MSHERLFLDTVFVQALVNRRDQFHEVAVKLLPRVQAAREVWVTEAILIEIGNALSAANRTAAVEFIRQCYNTPNIFVLGVDSKLLNQAVDLYQSHADKKWGLTDCISFVVMENHQLFVAVTADRHFVQAGFQALMLEPV